MKLILASASPRRAEILSDAGICFEVMPVRVDETPLPGEQAEAMCRRLAQAKAQAAAARLKTSSEPSVIIAADTTVEMDGAVLGKPESPADACEILGCLSGRTHRVLTALVLLRLPDGATRCDLEITAVRFAVLLAQEIDGYVATGEPMDKAGAYAIQGRAGCFIERIEGCYFNVVGLPLARLYRNLKELGWSPRAGA
jgi:nucleoside triphosphate pyrophosphatase